MKKNKTFKDSMENFDSNDKYLLEEYEEDFDFASMFDNIENKQRYNYRNESEY